MNQPLNDHIAPQRGPTRQQRAAMISEEVKMIQRDHPSPSFGEPDPNTLRPPGASKTVDPEAVGEDAAASRRMGENVSSTQEGPMAQGVGREVSEEDVSDTSKLARGARSPNDDVQEPLEGGAGVVGSDTGSAQIKPDVKAGEAIQAQPAPTKATSNQAAYLLSRHDIVNGTYTGSTIAGDGFQYIMAEQIDRVRRHTAGGRTIHKRTERPMSRKMVRGEYDPAKHLSAGNEKQPALGQVARTTSLNGTYMPKDTERFLTKVRSLLPATAPQSSQQQQKRPAAKAS